MALALSLCASFLLGYGLCWALEYVRLKSSTKFMHDCLSYNDKLAQKGMELLKAQTIEQAVNAKDAELRYKLQRDAAVDELKRYAERVTEQGNQPMPLDPPSELVYDIDGNAHKVHDLEFSWR